MRMIILAAGQGTRLRPHTDHVPKCMVPVRGRPLISWLLDVARSVGISDITVVGGYLNEKLQDLPVEIVVNSEFATTNMVYSLDCALQKLEGDVIISYADILYEPRILRAIVLAPQMVAVTVDRGWLRSWQARFVDPLDDAESLSLGADGLISEIGGPVGSINDIEGQYIGLIKFSGKGLAALRDLMAVCKAGEIVRGRRFENMYMTDLLQALIDRGIAVSPVWTDGSWFEVDSSGDLELAEQKMTINGTDDAPTFTIDI